jgi:hypothetical protein
MSQPKHSMQHLQVFLLGASQAPQESVDEEEVVRHPHHMPLVKPRTYLPNWALAAILAGFVGGTYLYSMRAVGSDDLEKELARENERQRIRQGGES